MYRRRLEQGAAEHFGDGSRFFLRAWLTKNARNRARRKWTQVVGEEQVQQRLGELRV